MVGKKQPNNVFYQRGVAPVHANYVLVPVTNKTNNKEEKQKRQKIKRGKGITGGGGGGGGGSCRIQGENTSVAVEVAEFRNKTHRWWWKLPNSETKTHRWKLPNHRWWWTETHRWWIYTPARKKISCMRGPYCTPADVKQVKEVKTKPGSLNRLTNAILCVDTVRSLSPLSPPPPACHRCHNFHQLETFVG